MPSLIDAPEFYSADVIMPKAGKLSLVGRAELVVLPERVSGTWHVDQDVEKARFALLEDDKLTFVDVEIEADSFERIPKLKTAPRPLPERPPHQGFMLALARSSLAD